MSRESKYSSHLPVLKLIFDFIDIKSVFEYGCGMYSTRFFVDRCDKIVSIEMQNEKWYEKVQKEIVSNKLNLYCLLGDVSGIDNFKLTNEKYDLVFVDGINREECVRNAFDRTEIIVIHDIGERRWNQVWKKSVIVPDRFNVIVVKIATPPTTVITSNKELLCQLQKFESIIIK